LILIDPASPSMTWTGSPSRWSPGAPPIATGTTCSGISGPATCRATPSPSAPKRPAKPESERSRWRRRAHRASPRADRARHPPPTRRPRTHAGRDHRASGARHRPRRDPPSQTWRPAPTLRPSPGRPGERLRDGTRPTGRGRQARRRRSPATAPSPRVRRSRLHRRAAARRGTGRRPPGRMQSGSTGPTGRTVPQEPAATRSCPETRRVWTCVSPAVAYEQNAKGVGVQCLCGR